MIKYVWLLIMIPGYEPPLRIVECVQIVHSNTEDNWTLSSCMGNTRPTVKTVYIYWDCYHPKIVWVTKLLIVRHVFLLHSNRWNSVITSFVCWIAYSTPLLCGHVRVDLLSVESTRQFLLIWARVSVRYPNILVWFQFHRTALILIVKVATNVTLTAVKIVCRALITARLSSFSTAECSLRGGGGARQN